jgi:hypothetical protein
MKGVDPDESVDDSSYHIYKNIEFVLWKMDQKKPRKDVSSILDSLNESRDDSIDSSLFMQNQDISHVPKDGTLEWDSQSNNGFAGKAPSSISGMSEVASVFNMGTEKYMGSEKHYMSENFDYAASNAGVTLEGLSSTDGNERLKGLYQKPKRVDKRKEGPVKLSYTGKETTPVENKPTNKLKSSKRAYSGAISYTGPKKMEAMVSELEINNSSKLHDYSKREGVGIPLKSVDDGQKDLNKTDNSDGPNNFSLFALMKNHEEEKVNRMRMTGNIKDGSSNMKQNADLETIVEEKTKSDLFTESKTMDKDTTQGEQSNRERLLGATTSDGVTLNDSGVYYPFPSGDVLKELHREDLIKKLVSDSKNTELSNNLSNTNLSYQQVLQMTNKTIPPIMKNLFNDSYGEHQSMQNTQQMSYANMNPYGYYAPPVPYQVPYQMPYPPNLPMPGTMPHPEMMKPPSTGAESSTVNSTPPNLDKAKTPEIQPGLNSKNMMNMQSMTQPPMQQYPVYKILKDVFVDLEAKYAQNDALRYQQQMAYYNQPPQGYYGYQYAPPQMPPYNMPPAQNMPHSQPMPYQHQMMMQNNQYPPPYQYGGYMQPPYYPPSNQQYYQQEQPMQYYQQQDPQNKQ